MEKEHQTRDGCSGGKLKITPHFTVCWICNDRHGRRDFKKDIPYRPHLLSVVGAGTDQPFYVAMHLSKWDVFNYMHGGSHTYCRAAGTGAGQCVSTKTSPALKVLGNERARFPPKCKRRVGLQLLETQVRTFQTSKNHHSMLTNRFLSHPGTNILIQLSKWMLHFPGPLLHSTWYCFLFETRQQCGSGVTQACNVSGFDRGEGTANKRRVFRRKAQEHPPLHCMLDV